MPYHDDRFNTSPSWASGLRLFAGNVFKHLKEQRDIDSSLLKSKILARAAEDRDIRTEKRRAAQARTVELSRRQYAEGQNLDLQTFQRAKFKRELEARQKSQMDTFREQKRFEAEAERIKGERLAPPAIQKIWHEARGLPGGFTGRPSPSETGIQPLTVAGLRGMGDAAKLKKLLEPKAPPKGFKPQVKTQFVNFIGDDPDQPTVAGRVTTIYDFDKDKETVKMYTWDAKNNRWGKPPPGYKPMQIGATGELQQRLRMKNQTVMSPAIVTLLLGNKAARAKLIVQGKLPKEGEPITYAHIKKMFPALKLEQLPGGVGFAIRKRDQDTLQRIVDAGHFAYLAGDVIKIAEETVGVMDITGRVGTYIDRLTAIAQEAWGLLGGMNRLGSNVTREDIQGTGKGGYILDDDGNRRVYTGKDRTTKYIYGTGGDHDTVVRRALNFVTKGWAKRTGWLSKIKDTAMARHVMESTIFSMAMALMASRGIKGSRISTKLVEKTIQEIGGVNLSYGAFRARMQSIMGRELKRMLDAGIVPFGKRLKKENIFSLWGFDADPIGREVKKEPVTFEPEKPAGGGEVTQGGEAHLIYKDGEWRKKVGP